MKIILDLIKDNLWKYIAALAMSTVAGLAGAAAIKHIHAGMKDGIGPNFLGEFALYMLGSIVLGLCGAYLLTLLAERNLRTLRLRLSEQVMQASYQKVEEQSDKIVPIITHEITIVGKAAGKIPEAVTNAAIIIGCLGYMFYLSPTMTIVAVSIFALNFFMTVFVMPRVRKSEEGMRILRYKLFNQLKDMVNGLKELNFKKGLRSKYIEKLIGPTTALMIKIKVSFSILIQAFRNLEQLIIMTSLAVAIYLVQTHWEQENFLEYFGLVLFLMVPLTRVNSFFRMLNITSIAIKHIEGVGLELSELKRPPAKQIPEHEWNSSQPIVSFDGVTHEYKSSDGDRPFKLGPIDFKAYENETVFIIGGNGSGKTTLVKLLTGLYKPKKGSILYKNHVIQDEFLEHYQDNFAALFSDSHVFNLLFHIDEDIVKNNGPHYLDYLGLSNKVKVHPEAERFTNMNLSYGQKKRLNLTISLLENKEIYVFDEWAANQDPQFKKVFYEVILEDLKKAGKTVFCISHDDAYFHKADRFLKLRDGELIENRLNEHVTEAELQAIKSG